VLAHTQISLGEEGDALSESTSTIVEVLKHEHLQVQQQLQHNISQLQHDISQLHLQLQQARQRVADVELEQLQSSQQQLLQTSSPTSQQEISQLQLQLQQLQQPLPMPSQQQDEKQLMLQQFGELKMLGADRNSQKSNL
jgi:predicted RNase H-like nuclease (RuvC/YqgF family)